MKTDNNLDNKLDLYERKIKLALWDIFIKFMITLAIFFAIFLIGVIFAWLVYAIEEGKMGQVALSIMAVALYISVIAHIATNS